MQHLFLGRPDPEQQHAARRMSNAEIEKLRTGDHKYDIDIEDFYHLPAAIRIIPTPKTKDLYYRQHP